MKGQSILITGGTGFLGHALIPRLIKDNKVVVMARNEGKLLETKQKFPSIHILAGDVSEPYSCRKAVSMTDACFHLAGFKHVGLAEQQPFECIKSNITGTISLLEAIQGSTYDFVIGTSTDKAAQVAGVYGASKLAMERLFAEANTTDRFTNYRIVRYGNVLYSTGSVLCKWKEALQTGKPITISDPEATRFYWTADQAVDLLFECLTKASDATPYVPVMKSMRLGDILMAMEEKYGRAVDVVTTGLKAGENKAERLTFDGPTSDQVEKFTMGEIMDLI
jgi:UDP-N-acetylglucosamine 4,6-dehydratase